MLGVGLKVLGLHDLVVEPFEAGLQGAIFLSLFRGHRILLIFIA